MAENYFHAFALAGVGSIHDLEICVWVTCHVFRDGFLWSVCHKQT